MKYFWIALGGAAGTLIRYGVTTLMIFFVSSRFPLGTMIVNIIGSLVIGLLWGLNQSNPFSPNLAGFLFIGLLGGFTTFSAFSLENLQLLREGEIRLALIYILASSVGGLLAAYAGLRLSGNYLQG